jgi:DnaJ family protein C protein 7
MVAWQRGLWALTVRHSRWQRARAYSELKEHWEAVADLERALEVEPGQKDVARVQQHLTAARAKLEAEGDDHYAVLGVLPDAEEAAVRKAYKRLALLHHPDKAVGGGEMRARAERRFKRVADAHSILSDKEKRREYDRERERSRAQRAGYCHAPSLFPLARP